MSKKGCILLARKIQESEIWQKPADWLKYFIYILQNVNYKETSTCERGEGFFTYHEIAYNCKGRYNSVAKFIKWGKSAMLVATRKTTRGVYIKVLNYEEYQELENYKSDTRGDTGGKLAARQRQDRGDTISKERKKEYREVVENKESEKQQQQPEILEEKKEETPKQDPQEIFELLECPRPSFLKAIQKVIREHPNTDILAVAQKVLVVKYFDHRWIKFVNMAGSEFTNQQKKFNQEKWKTQSERPEEDCPDPYRMNLED